MIISTSMSTPDEIRRTVEAVSAINAVRADAPPRRIQRRSGIQLDAFRLQATCGVPVGSPTTLGNFIALGAVTLGANLFEKHFTLSARCPDPISRLDGAGGLGES
jgi:sialic acid synthase SpsE